VETLLTQAQVSAITGRAEPTLEKDRVAGRGIPFVKLGRSVRYRLSVVEDFIASLPVYRSTAEYTTAAQVERGPALPDIDPALEIIEAAI
jgi:hypothetical protein